MSLNIFGIRHHGPGCSRSLNAALETLQPDILLVEAPPEGEEIIELAANPEMIPPVAMIVYPPDKPDAAVFYPFASFSPEWNAIQFALKKNIPLRFIDLPYKHRFALDETETEKEIEKEKISKQKNNDANSTNSPDSQSQDANSPDANIDANSDNDDAKISAADKSFAQQIIDDPLGVLSQAAGFDDNETWWEQVIEQSKGESIEIFNGIFEAMFALRERVNAELDENKQDVNNFCNENSDGGNDSTDNKRNENSGGFDARFFRDRCEVYRESWMRQCVRKALSEGFRKIAVVCGAWHAPVLNVISDSESLTKLTPTEKADDFLLRKLPKSKLKVSVTWTPWTFSRLAYRSGYGAGVVSPGWYEHLWTTPDRAALRWISLAARLLRAESFDASAANIIEAVRLADSLASLRNRPAVGLAEVNESILTTLCRGDFMPLNLIRRKLETGYKIGSVPKETPAVPLLRDIEAEQKRLRMKVSEEIISIDLDLRKESDRAKSRLLHRLNLIGVEWGKLGGEQVRSLGTFHEFWQLQWQVEFVVRIIESNVLGNTIESAVSGAVRGRSETIKTLPELTALIEAALKAEVSAAAIDELLERLRNESAVSTDTSGLMLAIPSLSNILQYGDVRGTKAKNLEPVYNAIFERILASLVLASSALDDEAAAKRVVEINVIQDSLRLYSTETRRKDWQGVLVKMSKSDVVHGLLRGRCTRILYEDGVMSEEDLGRSIGLAVTTTVEAIKVAQWMQGFLYGSGQLLLQYDLLWGILNLWLSSLSEEKFKELLPLLRRAFSEFSMPEIRMMSEKVKKLGLPNNSATKIPNSAAMTMSTSIQKKNTQVDEKRIELVLPILRKIIAEKF
ncbi:MAG: DUF5682 family protein [Planctomycetaceae bacterium]|jgi:hypothetical protein|nr:DUF5682 family protein [Planctomycetaceae bacterium]